MIQQSYKNCYGGDVSFSFGDEWILISLPRMMLLGGSTNYKRATELLQKLEREYSFFGGTIAVDTTDW